MILIGLGLLATALRVAGYPLAPLLIGFILGPMLEDNFSRAVQLYDGFGFLTERPLTIVLLVLSLILVALPTIKRHVSKKKQEIPSNLND